MPGSRETIRVLVSQRPPEKAIERLREAVGAEGVFEINPDPDVIWSKEELVAHLKAGQYNALYCMLTNKIDAEVLDAAPGLKIVANMAVGFNNVDVHEATRRGV